ncbi:MAG TPA: hypothetical protein VGH20_11415 [Myxococcales bacterium]|jgi:hypothetical protein
MKHESIGTSFARESDHLIRALVGVPFVEKVAAYESLKRKYLQRVSDKETRLEVRRRIAESLLMASISEPWPIRERYLRRLKRLGFTEPSQAVLACGWASRNAAAKNDARAVRIIRRLIARTRPMLAQKHLHRRYVAEHLARLAEIESRLDVATVDRRPSGARRGSGARAAK